ncbi:MAG: hypothetical protein GY725_15040, partial [bacterium]|nr:hypothetical protein [bacterium]
MNWDAIGAVGEMIGATAVVATLWILLLQMRQNTRALHENSRGARRTAADQNFRDLSRFRDMMVRDPELASIWHNGCQGESLADVEAERFMGLLNELIFGLWRGFEGAKNLGDQVYLDEIVRISASAGAFPTIGNRLREIAQ